jgi:Trk K+ transport system NAD-binding subunit
MKFNPAIISYFFQRESTRRNVGQLLKFLLILALLVTVYSVLFHFLMAAEGQDHSWITGFYWTLTVMSTLGFGDITFQSDVGRAFSIVVLLSGMIFLLTLLPFTFIKFFYAPWMEAESRKRAPRELPPETRDHVIITNYDPVTAALIEKLKDRRRDYVVIVDDFKRALDLYDVGVRVAVGAIDDPETYRRMRVGQAALIIATNRDEINTNIAFTVRELSDRVPIITTADSPYSEDILQMAGSNRVLQLHDVLGRSLAAWTVGGDCRANIISRFDELLIAEFPAMGTPLVGKTLAESRLRENFGVTVVGIWERGQFVIPHAHSLIERTSVIVLAGAEKNLAAYDEIYAFYHICKLTAHPVLIIGGGPCGTYHRRALQGAGDALSDRREESPSRPGRSACRRRGRGGHTDAPAGLDRKGPCRACDHPRRRHEHLPDQVPAEPEAGHADSQPGQPGAQCLDASPRRRRFRHVLLFPGGQRHSQLSAE